MEQAQTEQKLEHLQRALDAKVSQMARVQAGDSQMASLRAHYDRVLKDLQSERDELQRERVNLLLVRQTICNSLVVSAEVSECSFSTQELRLSHWPVI